MLALVELGFLYIWKLYITCFWCTKNPISLVLSHWSTRRCNAIKGRLSTKYVAGVWIEMLPASLPQPHAHIW